MRYLLGFHDQINPGSGPAAAWPALSATFPESGDTTPKPSAQATYLAGLPRHDDARPTASHTICLALFSLSASTSRHISRTTQHCPHITHHAMASRKDMRRPDLSTSPPIIHHPHASASSDTSRANQTLQSCRMPNRQRTNQTATWRVSNMGAAVNTWCCDADQRLRHNGKHAAHGCCKCRSRSSPHVAHARRLICVL
jgi:hypothetical protein